MWARYVSRRGLAAAISLLGLTLSGCATSSEGVAEAAIARGRRVAMESCASCHVVSQGQSGREVARRGAPDFDDPGFIHTAALPGRLANLTRLGHYVMPPRGLSQGQLDDLLAFIEGGAPRD